MQRQHTLCLSFFLLYLILLFFCFEGMFFNQALPSGVGGDAIRIWRMHRSGIRMGRSARSVLLDRIFGLTGLLTLGLVSLPLFLETVTDPVMSGGYSLILMAGFGGFFFLVAMDFLPSAVRGLKLLKPLASMSEGARACLTHPATFMPVMLISLPMRDDSARNAGRGSLWVGMVAPG